MKVAFVSNQSASKLHNKKYFKVLFKVSELVGLSVPNLYSYSGLAVWYLIYSVLLCVSLAGICAWTLYGRIAFEYPKIIQTAAVLDALIIAASTSTNVVSIISAIIVRRRSTVKLLRVLREIEKDLVEKFGIEDPYVGNNLSIKFFCMEFMVTSYVIFVSTFDLIYKGPFGFSYCVCLYLNVLLVSITVNQLQFFSTVIKQSFQLTNKKLIEVIHFPDKPQSNGKLKPSNMDMRFFLKFFDKLCDTVDLVNQSYGVQIVFISFVIILCLIESLNLLMKIALGIETLEYWKTYVIIGDTWNSLIYIIYGIIIAVSCDQTSSEVSYTSTVSYKLLLDFPSCPKTLQEEITKSELLLLAEHLNQRKIHFSAAGFFSVDHTMLYMIFGSIAAYLVIVLQFN